MAKKTRRAFVVRFEMPDGATAFDALNYVKDAVQSLKGSYHPDEPMFGLDRETVTVSFLKEDR